MLEKARKKKSVSPRKRAYQTRDLSGCPLAQNLKRLGILFQPEVSENGTGNAAGLTDIVPDPDLVSYYPF